MNAEETELMKILVNKIGDSSSNDSYVPTFDDIQEQIDNQSKRLDHHMMRLSECDDEFKKRTNITDKTFNDLESRVQICWTQLDHVRDSQEIIYASLNVIKRWIKATTHHDKEKIRLELYDLDLETPPESDDWKNISVSKLEVNVRTIALLINNKIDTLGELAQITEEELLNNKNYGRSSLEKLKRQLSTYGITLKKKKELEEFKL